MGLKNGYGIILGYQGYQSASSAAVGYHMGYHHNGIHFRSNFLCIIRTYRRITRRYSSVEPRERGGHII